MQAGDLFERTIATSKGPIDMLAEVVVDGDTLHLKDVAIFPRTAEPLTGPYPEILAARTQLASEMGFKQLRITGKRVATSSSAHLGKEIDVTSALMQ
jgi:hypothetical protein